MSKTQPVQVNLTPGKNQDGSFVWWMGIGTAQPGPPPYPSITIANGNKGIITFTLQNAPNISFATNPVLVPPKVTIDDPVVSGASMTLTDHNLKAGSVPYVIVFDGAPKLDPIINNNGGGSISFWSSTSSLMSDSTFDAWMAIVFVAGILVALGVRMLKRRNANPSSINQPNG